VDRHSGPRARRARGSVGREKEREGVTGREWIFGLIACFGCFFAWRTWLVEVKSQWDLFFFCFVSVFLFGMARTRQTARRSTRGRAPRRSLVSALETRANEAVDYEHEFDSFAQDVLWEDDGEEKKEDGDTSSDSGDEEFPGFSGRARKLLKDNNDESQVLSASFDFRRGSNRWPEGVELIDEKKAEELIKKAEQTAQETKAGGDDDAWFGSMMGASMYSSMTGNTGGATGSSATGVSAGTSTSAGAGMAAHDTRARSSMMGGSDGASSALPVAGPVGPGESQGSIMASMGFGGGFGAVETNTAPVDLDDRVLDDPLFNQAPSNAQFATLKDHSTALVLMPGMRLKLDLEELTSYGAATKRRARSRKEAQRREQLHKRGLKAQASMARENAAKTGGNLEKLDAAAKEAENEAGELFGGSRNRDREGSDGDIDANSIFDDDDSEFDELEGPSRGRSRIYDGMGGTRDESPSGGSVVVTGRSGVRWDDDVTMMGAGDGFGRWGDFGGFGNFSSFFKTYVNKYTITMDVKFEYDPPRSGLSLFQTRLVHVEENQRTGKKRVKQSDGECMINSEGGVGIFGTYGDTTKAKVEKSKWKRLVISVNCGDEDQKGLIRTWVDSVPCAVVQHEEIIKDGRFALDPDALFLFSSKNHSMMPGHVQVRHIRVDATFMDNAMVREQRARDKIISMYDEERKDEIDKQRKGLTLSVLFPKPRPIWGAPTLTATFGDAFIEGTTLEASSLLSWSYTVLNFTLSRALNEMSNFLGPLNSLERAGVSDAAYIFSKSGVMMRQMIKLLRHRNKTQLMSFLRKLRSTLGDLDVGDTLLLPVIVENKELVIIMTRTTDQAFRFVIVNTDPLGGLQYHSASPVAGPPKLKYRSCMVLNNVTKKNALDNVFWMAVYNLALKQHDGDTERFYDILLPFLTGKSLETSLVEAEVQGEHGNDDAASGPWRSPQRSRTAYVRCLLESLHYVLREKGLNEVHAKLVTLAIRAQFVKMIANDMDFVHPDLNGIRVCRMACSQLAYSTVKLAEKVMEEVVAPSGLKEGNESAVKKYERRQRRAELSRSIMLEECKKLTFAVLDKIKACEDDSVELPAILELSKAIYETPKNRSVALDVVDAEKAAASADVAPVSPEHTLATKPEAGKEISDENALRVKVKHTLPRRDRAPIILKVDKMGSVAQLFELLENETGVPVEKQRLIYLGRILDPAKSLKDFNLVKENQVIHLAVSKTIGREEASEESKQKSMKEKLSEALSSSQKGAEDLDEKERARQMIQFCDTPVWRFERNIPNPGAAASLKKYVPIDFLQLPERVVSRAEAVDVLRQMDKLCTLLDNQNHCIKNDKFLILNMIQFVITHVMPMPQPREESQNPVAKFKADRAFRRQLRRQQKKEEAEAKRKNQQNEKKDAHEEEGKTKQQQHQQPSDNESEDNDSDWNDSENSSDYEEDWDSDIGNYVRRRRRMDDDKDKEEAEKSAESESSDEEDDAAIQDELELTDIDADIVKKMQVKSMEDISLESVKSALEKLDAEKEDALNDTSLLDMGGSHSIDYLDDERFSPGLGQRVRVLFHGERGIWYNGTVSRVNEDGTFFVVYEDGDTEDRVPRSSIRSTFAPRIHQTREERTKLINKLYSRIEKRLKEILAKLERKAKSVKASAEEAAEADRKKDSKEESSALEGEEREDVLKPSLSKGKEAESKATSRQCLWSSEPMDYALQVEVLMTLQRLMEHFAAAAFSIQQCRPLDAVCIIVPGCITAIADCVMRQVAHDTPSEACTHLLGRTREGRQLGVPGFGISVATFADQTETIEVHTPELNLARAAVLDYFESPEQRRYFKIFTWETAPEVKPNPSLVKYLRNICRETAGTEANAPHYLLLDKHPKSSRLLKNFPELECYRDIVFWWKYFLNPDVTSFPNYGGSDGRDINRFDRMVAQLSWKWNSENLSYDVRSFSNRFMRCRPFPDVNYIGLAHGKDRQPPKHRFPSTATPSFYLSEPEVKTEDDIIYRPSLPAFEETVQTQTKTSIFSSSSGSKKDTSTTKLQILGQHDSELLLSYLTVPYIRLPLVLTFFASDDRLHKLQSTKLRDILDSVMFEPNRYLSLKLRGVEPVLVPTPYKELLATPYGTLINELCSSPETILRATMALLKDALALDTGSVCDIGAEDFNTSVQIILFAARLGARLDNYLSLLVRNAKAEKGDFRRADLRDTQISPECVAKLDEGMKQIRGMLLGSLTDLFNDYLQKLDDQTRRDPTDEDLIRRNSHLACDLHAHKLLVCRNVSLEDMTPHVAKTLIGSFIYLTTRHTWNKALRLDGRLLIPEFELYEVLQVQRRMLVGWCKCLRQGDLDRVMQHSLQVSTSTSGSLGTTDDFLSASNRWSRISGIRSIGRYAVSSTRIASGPSKDDEKNPKLSPVAATPKLDDDDTDSEAGGPIAKSPSRIKLLREHSFNNQVGEISDQEMFGVEMDLQIGQMTLRSRHLSALKSEIANHPDMKELFGNATLQVSLLERAEHRERYRLVGLQHDIEWWHTPHDTCPPLGDEWERDYDPSELFPSESWIPFLFEPIRKSFFDGPMPPAMQFLMPEWALPEDAEVAVLLGLHQTIGGPFKLVYLFRRLRCVHVYECVTHGRQWWWSLHLTTDARLCLRELQPTTAARMQPFPKWWSRGAGKAYPNGVSGSLLNKVQGGRYFSNPQKSVLIVRENAHPDNVSGGKETYIPDRMLFGIVPECLLNEYYFWMDETWESECKVPCNLFGSVDEEKSNQKAENDAPAQQQNKAKRARKKKTQNTREGYRSIRILRGYPRDEDGEYIILCEFRDVGSWLELMRRKPGEAGANKDTGIESTGGLPGSTVRITRFSKTAYKKHFEDKQNVALLIDTLGLIKNKMNDPFMKLAMTRQERMRKKAIEKMRKRIKKRMAARAKQMGKNKNAPRGKAAGISAKATPDDTVKDDSLLESEFDVNPSGREDELRVGSQLKYMVKRGQYIDVVIIAKNSDSTFDVKGVRGPDAGMSLERVEGRDLHRFRPKGIENGEGIWHWDGLSSSEEEDWASESDDEDSDTKKKEDEKDVSSDDENSEEDDKKKGRKSLTFQQFLILDRLIEAAGRDVDLCMDLLYRISSTRGVTFPDIESLAVALSAAKMDENAFFNAESAAALSEIAPPLGITTVPMQESEGGKKEKTSESLQDGAMVMLDLLYAPRGSRLFSLARTLSRIENLSNICAWTNLENLAVWEDDLAWRHGQSVAPSLPIRGCVAVDLVELPRLKLSFTLRKDFEGNLRLYSMDHADLFVCNERDPSTTMMLRGIPHSLLVSNTQGELQVLVPLVAPVRPKVYTQPFSTDLVLDREDGLWNVSISQRYFLYPVHVSLSFLETRGLESAMYLMLLRFLHRDYDTVFRLTDSVATDTNLGETAEIIFKYFMNANDDWHPDAHACRLKISLVTIDSGVNLPWELTTQCARYAVKLPHVRASCRISLEEELQILQNERRIVIDKKHKLYDKSIHDMYTMTLVKNRLHALKAQLSSPGKKDVRNGTSQVVLLEESKDDDPESNQRIVEANCWVPPRGVTTSWPYYIDKTVFGESYEEVININTIEEWNELESGGIEQVIRKRAMASDEDDEDGISSAHRSGVEFPSVYAPPGGWLVLACFHVLWKPVCVKAMLSIAELAPAYSSCTFLSIRADSLEIAPLAKKLNIKTFPTFVLLRGSKVVEDGRVFAEERITEALVTLLKKHVTPEDEKQYSEVLRAERRYLREKLRLTLQGMGDVESPDGGKNGKEEDGQKRRKATKEEREAEANAEIKRAMEQQLAQLDSDNEESDYDDEDLQWTWDVDQGGPAVAVTGLGMKVVLKAEEIDAVQAVWEWALEYDSGANWNKLAGDQNKELEMRYASGELYKSGQITIQRGETGRKLEVWENSVNITSYLLTGFQGRFIEGSRQYIKLRRRGARLPVQGEPEVSPEQRMRDEHMRRQREYDLHYRKVMAEQRRGKDNEAIRGTVGFVPHSGIHRWTLKWNHEPSREGNGDSVGLCSENCEDFGPGSAPILGSSQDSSSLSLYANGKLFHHGKVLVELAPRFRASQEGFVARSPSPDQIGEDAPDTLISKKTSEDTIVDDEEEQPDQTTEKEPAASELAQKDEDEDEEDEGDEGDAEEDGQPTPLKDFLEEARFADSLSKFIDNGVASIEALRQLPDLGTFLQEKINVTDRGARKEFMNAFSTRFGGERRKVDTARDRREKRRKERKKREDDLFLPILAKAQGTLGTSARVLMNEKVNIWGRGSMVTFVLDTDKDGGVLTFEIDGEPIEDCSVPDAFSILGANVLYPCISLAPFDTIAEPKDEEQKSGGQNQSNEENEEAKKADEDKPSKKEKPKGSKQEKGGGTEDEKAAPENAEMEEEEDEERKTLIKVLSKTTGINDEAALKDFDNEKLEKLAARAEEIIKSQPKEPCVLLLTDKQLEGPMEAELAQKEKPKDDEKKKRRKRRGRESKQQSESEESEESESDKSSEESSASDEDESHSDDEDSEYGSEAEGEASSAHSSEVETEKKKKREKKGGGKRGKDDVSKIPVERCVWMFQRDDMWEKYTTEMSAKLERTRRSGAKECEVSIKGERMLVRFKKLDNHAAQDVGEQTLTGGGGDKMRVRRQVVTKNIAAGWETLSVKYDPPASLYGQTVLDILEKVWANEETMDGRRCGLGFLFLYGLLQGKLRCRIGGSGFGGFGGFSGFGGFGGFGWSPWGESSAGKSDSHRFATLLMQLYKDRRLKSIPASIINVLVRNRQLCSRMPEFRDTRKFKRSKIFNGWTDEREPRSPLADLMSQVVPSLQNLKRKRGAMQFPPPPPYPELSEPPKSYKVVLGPNSKALERPELTDLSCSMRKLEPVTNEEIVELATSIGLKLGGELERLRVEPPLAIEDEDHYERVMEILAQKQTLVVIEFHASWCQPCKALAPMFLAMSRRTPGVRFLKVDVDECDMLADLYEVHKLPCVKCFRGGTTPDHCLQTLSGMGENWETVLDGVIHDLCSEEERKAIQQFRRSRHAYNTRHEGEEKDADADANNSEEGDGTSALETPEESRRNLLESNEKMDLGTTRDELDILARQPLRQVFSYLVQSTRQEFGLEDIDSVIPFNVSKHDAAANAVAKSMLKRMQDDVEFWAKTANSSSAVSLVVMPRAALREFCDGSDDTSKIQAAVEGISKLLEKLHEIREKDSKVVEEMLPLLTHAANWVNLNESSSSLVEGDKAGERTERVAHVLRRESGQETFIWIEFLFGALLSTAAEEDILRLNPYLSQRDAKTILKIVTVVLLRANRVGHANRCIGTCIKLRAKMRKLMKMPKEKRMKKASELVLSLTQMGENLGEALSDGRHFVRNDGASFDPRFLIFEFTWNLLLRQKQVEIVEMFMQNLDKGVSKVKQMIMGAGKTTVVAPLLALMLADGHSLVMSVVPKALLEMSRTRMRETFATIMQKRIYTLQFDRSTAVHPSMRRGLENAVRNRGIVVATPTTVKSIMLAYVETLEKISRAKDEGVTLKQMAIATGGKPARGEKSPGSALTLALDEQAEELQKILELFRNGSMLLDEVDLILHPLKSELNFPMGEKYDLDSSQQGERWSLPTHLLDAIFFTERGKVSTFEQRGQALEILKRLSACIEEGYECRALQKLPHITLLNLTFYQAKMRPILAEWAYLWLQKHHLHGIDHAEAIRYIVDGGEPRSFAEQKVGGLKELAKEKPLSKTGQRVLSSLEEIHRQTDELYIVEGELAEHMSRTQNMMGLLQSRIARLTKKIEEAQYPRDDSLDNNVVVWLSVAFSLNQSDSRALHQGSVHSQCAKLEESGLSIKRCEDEDETVKRSKDLFNAGQLRCLIIGGDETRVGCGEDCEGHHNTICLRCGQDWGAHSGHTCGHGNGARGAFPSENADEIYDIVSIVLDLTQGEKTVKVPPNRIFVFAAHCSIDAEDRMLLWEEGVTVVETAEELLKVVEDVPEYESQQNAKKDIEEDADCVDVETKDGEPAGGQTGFNSDDDDDVIFLRGTLGRDKHGRKLGGSSKSSSDDPLAKIPAPPRLERVLSAGSQELQVLRRRLESLEFAKSEMSEEEEEERAQFRERISDTRARLQSSIEQIKSEMRVAIRQISDDMVPKNERPAIDSDSFRVPYIHPLRQGIRVVEALEWIESGKQEKSSAKYMFDALWTELRSLERQALGAKVVARVSPQHKKLLNLTRDWLRTYLPHCLGKINRVSFGLLNDEDCKRALKEDPLMPRSRLKLAVPFVGKDVPSSSSEFAHPDITIGLTILAYRYSGLRESDFETVVDDLTMEFSREIGPARERKSSQRYEQWVSESGGLIRGVKDMPPSSTPTPTPATGVGSPTSAFGARSPILPRRIGDDASSDGPLEPLGTTVGADQAAKDRFEMEEKEVVQLKYLQKSNKEQMLKLYRLWKFEPLVIHHYLSHTILPAHMRSQKVKISASGQAVGGDMLFGKRVGFSGTPSDLLPKEMGRCDYEDGDDGKMLTTVLDPNTTGYEYIKSGWTVEDLLRGIAEASNPRYHALIDTGALITGYTNKEVAEALLDFGLPWCDGVVFLDDDDKQQVLVRATGRVISADQCGVPLEKRFAFYDQIHTTGMDIKHVVNARAVITLGKDMVFRDYVQGAFRMRGIGKGQTICAYIIPEVQELMKRELLAAHVVNGTYTRPGIPNSVSTLIDVVAWLVINSMRSEQVQWSMLCMQNISNVYRKNALKQLMSEESYKMDAVTAMKPALSVFREKVDFALESNVPDPLPFTKRLENMIESHSNFIFNENEKSIGKDVLKEVEMYSGKQEDTSQQRLESEQEREQEQEQEKEVRAKREQQIEVEKFVDREYSRADEQPKAWPFRLLAQDPARLKQGSRLDAESKAKATAEAVDEDYPFYPLSGFCLRHQEPLEFPAFMYFSRNYFNPSWNGLRRVKNVVMVLEWVPSRAKMRDLTPKECVAMHPINAESKKSLEKAYELLSVRTGELSAEDVLQAVWAATDIKLTEVELADILAEYGTARSSLTLDGLQKLLTRGRLRRIENGRNYVIVSLAEAETIRRILHLRATQERAVITSSDTEISLRYTPISTMGSAEGKDEDTSRGAALAEEVVDPSQLDDAAALHQVESKFSSTTDGSMTLTSSSPTSTKGTIAIGKAAKAVEYGIVMDSSPNWRSADGVTFETGASAFQASLAHNCARFLDCNMHFRTVDLNVLLCALQRNSEHSRELFFLHTMGCKRRMDRKWNDTPLAKVFTVPDEWCAFKQRAQAVFVREAIRSKRLTEWEAFTAFDSDDNGLLSPAEFYGALRWLGVPNLTPNDVIDMIEVADRNRDGMIDYKEYIVFLEGEEEAAERADQEDEEHEQSADGTIPHSKPLVEPYGADILREVMVQRAREEMQRQEEERIRREAYNRAFDIKVFEEELEASKSREEGANPKLQEFEDGTRVCEYSFVNNDKPLRMSTSGHGKFASMLWTYMTDAAISSIQKIRCKRGHEMHSTWRTWYKCSSCGTRNSRYQCQKLPCDFNYCSRCYERMQDEKKRERSDLSKLYTYFNCSSGASLTLQVPTAITDSAKVSPNAGEDVSASVATAEEEEEEAIIEKTRTSSGAAFTITMEVRIDRLPGAGVKHALVKYSGSAPGSRQSRKRNKANVYIDELGLVTNGTKSAERIAAAAGASISDSDEADMSDPSPSETAIATAAVSTGNDALEDDKKPEAKEKEKEKEKEVPPGHFKSGVWQVVSIVVDAFQKSMRTYVEGNLSCGYTGLSDEEVSLQHMITIFGGAQQRDMRGGAIRRIIIHNRPLHDEVAELTTQVRHKSKLNMLWFQARPAIKEDTLAHEALKGVGFEITVAETEEEALKIVEEDETLDCVAMQLWHSETEDDNGNIIIPGIGKDGTGKPPGLTIGDKLRNVNKRLPIFMEINNPPNKTKEYIVGELIKARWKGSKKFYPGRIARVGEPIVDKRGRTLTTYNIDYDDGDKEDNVKSSNIRPLNAPKNRRGNPYFITDDIIREMRKKGFVAYQKADYLEELAVFAAATRWRSQLNKEK